MIKKKLGGMKFLAIGYLTVILVGAILLCLPVSSKDGQWTPFISALFTSTSATCVTGLVVYDTVAKWSLFGQVIILLLIQTGGIGFMTIITMLSMFLKRKIGLHERKLLMESEGTNRLAGIVVLIKRIVLCTLIFEIAGALLLSIRFIADFGLAKGIWYAIFHSISAFCNAGFDLMGASGSLSAYVGDPIVSLTVSLLIIVGGLGFIVWSDIFDCKGKCKKFSLHTKVVLITSLILIVVFAILFFIAESAHSLSGLTFGEKIIASLFCVITPRTAGFYTINPASLTGAGYLITIFLMFVGGSTGGTAGGVKITTVVIALFAIRSTLRKDGKLEIGKRRISESVIIQAFSIIGVYLIVILLATLIICVAESNAISFTGVLFEVISAIATVGLTVGITSSLGGVSQVVIILLMFIGRVGAFGLISSFAEKKDNVPSSRPYGEIYIG